MGISIKEMLPTPTGWKSVKELSVGDTLFDDLGKPCEVISVSSPYQRLCYSVKFSDDEAIVVDGEQVWKTMARNINEGRKGSNKPPILRKREIDNREYAFFSVHNKLHHVSSWNDPEREAKFETMLASLLAEKPLRSSLISIRTTDDIANTVAVTSPSNVLNKKVAWNHKIPVSSALQLPDIDLSISPYVLGVWLGDGSNYGARITLHEKDIQIIREVEKFGYQIRFSKARRNNPHVLNATIGTLDRSSYCRRGHPKKVYESLSSPGRCLLCEQITDKARRRGEPLPPYTRFSLQEILRKENLLCNKHIPSIYLRASLQQRQELLQGLMDTDGYISKVGQCEFTTTTPSLAQDTKELINSLGIKCSIKEENATLYGIIHGSKFRIQFWSYNDFPVFRLLRKKILHKSKPSKLTRSSFRQIISVKNIGLYEVRDIKVKTKSGLFLISRSMISIGNATKSLIVDA